MGFSGGSFLDYTRTQNTFCIETGEYVAEFVVKRQNPNPSCVAETFTNCVLKVKLIVFAGMSLYDKAFYKIMHFQ